MSKLGTVRRSQLISTYGVGAVVPVSDESVMIAGLEYWPVNGPKMHEVRLERKLNITGFRRPPASSDENARDIPVVRFPLWYSCPGCNRIANIRSLAQPNSNKCLDCGVHLVPSRFIVICGKGHIDDFPYLHWVHKGRNPGAGHSLTLGAAGVSASLKDIEITCSCGERKSMEGSFSRNALSQLGRCRGKRPWLKDTELCEETPRTVQRGSSNVYFPITASALSIPPWSEGAYKVLQDYWAAIQHIKDALTLKSVIQGMGLDQGTSFTVDALVNAVLQRQGEGTAASGSLLVEEYQALCNGNVETSEVQDFVCTPAPGRHTVHDLFEQTMSVTKLKEVRALTGFCRLLPPSQADDPGRAARLSIDNVDWLPAIEIRGEGAFFRLSESRLKNWELNPDVIARAESVNENYRASFARHNKVPNRLITPRLLLVHTIAHTLINQWSLDCGYPAGDLRERLYVSGPDDAVEMTGFLVYTASTDAAGSLGGVTALLDEDKLRDSILSALGAAAWCSADPLCIESDASGVDSLNLAACHNCLLLPETSCEEQNVFLDRGMMVGTLDNRGLGYFSELISKLHL